MEQDEAEEEEGADQEAGQEEDESEVGRTETVIAVNLLVVRAGAGQAGPGGVTEDSPVESLQSSSTGLGTLSGTPVTPLTVLLLLLLLSTAGLVTERHLVSGSNTDSVAPGFLEDLSGVKLVVFTTPCTALSLLPVTKLTI